MVFIVSYRIVLFLITVTTPETRDDEAPISFSTTDSRVLDRSRVLGDPAVLQAGRVRPLVRTFRLPRPHDPPARLFVRDDLSLPHLPQERLEARAERRGVSGEPLAAADAGAARVSPVVARADAPSVQVLCAVRRRGRPLPHDDP
jgi:hypothetical protein